MAVVLPPATYRMAGYRSGQTGQTVNLLANAFEGSNPSPATILFSLSALRDAGVREYTIPAKPLSLGTCSILAGFCLA